MGTGSRKVVWAPSAHADLDETLARRADAASLLSRRARAVTSRRADQGYSSRSGQGVGRQGRRHDQVAEIADTVYESAYGAGAAQRNKLLGETMPKYSKLLDEAAAEYHKLKADRAVTKDHKDAAYKKWVAAYDAYKKEAGDPYHALPEEADAWAVAGKMKAAYTKK